MFRLKFYKTAILAFIALTVCSCDKFLELRPQDGITADKFWKNKEQLQAAVIGIYNGLNVGNGGKSPTEMFFMWGELRADFVIPGSNVTADENNVISNNILPSNPIANWQPIYRVINLCNTVLDFGPGVKDIDNTLTEAQLNNYLSEALTIRSLMYFYLVRTFRDAPLVLKSTATDADVIRAAKNTDTEILAQIVADLKLAETYAPETYGINAYDKGRITKYTVNALQADVYLWMDKYTDCIAACDKVINSNKFALVPGDLSWYGTLYVLGNSIESIFELQYDNQPSNLNPFFGMFQNTSGNNLRPRLKANPLIIDNFYTVDPLDDTNKDIRGLDVAIRLSDQIIAKYLVSSNDASFRHWIVYRFADILLMKAEACANAGRGQDAIDIVTAIRKRANALIATARTPLASDIDQIVTYIVEERAREFAFEGKRWFDLLRNAKRNNFARRDLLIGAAIMSVPPISQQSALNKLKDNNSLYLPIYLTEIQNNPNIVQNPFYK